MDTSHANNYIYIDQKKVMWTWEWRQANSLKVNSNQTRDRGAVHSTVQIRNISENLKPELLAHSYDLSTGAPIIASDGAIISGHGRVEAIKMSFYNEDRGNYTNYADYMNKIHVNKYTGLATNNTTCYILCRVIADKYDTVDIIHAANIGTLQYTHYELAKINAKRLKPTLIEFLSNLPMSERAKYYHGGMINATAHDDYINAKLVHALPDCIILSSFINSPDPEYKNISQAIINNIDQILIIKDTNVDIYNQLALALDKFYQIKQGHGSVDDFLLQLDIFDSDINGADFANFLNIFWSNTRSVTKLTSELALYLHHEQSIDLFSDINEDNATYNTGSMDDVQIIAPDVVIDSVPPVVNNKPTLDTPPPHIQAMEWQQRTLTKLNSALDNDEKRILISAPTGAGKAYLIMFIIQQLIMQNKTVLLLVDRIKLVAQLCEDATKFGFSYNLIQGAKNIIQPGNLLTIASVQSYFNKYEGGEGFDYIIQDECHAQYTPLAELLSDYAGIAIGCTATPTTRGLKRIYTHLIESVTYDNLVNTGVLVPVDVIEYKPIDMDTARILAGEWVADDVVERCQIGFDDWIVSTIIDKMPDRSIAFCASIDHCEQLKSRLDGYIECGVYTSLQNEMDRAKILDDYDNHRINMLITVATLSKGFNRPDITTIIDLRPLRKSITEYIQIIGRGTRSYGGKTHCTVMDFTGNWRRFGDKVMEMQRNGVLTAFESTYTDEDRLVVELRVSKAIASKISWLMEGDNLNLVQSIKRPDRCILELRRIAHKYLGAEDALIDELQSKIAHDNIKRTKNNQRDTTIVKKRGFIHKIIDFFNIF
jgi:superfamily II DNA or RNA helicase